jgi:MFS family permease
MIRSHGRIALLHKNPLIAVSGKSQRGPAVFALLYTLESCARSLTSSVVPISAYELLKDEQKVSVLFTFVSVFSLAASLMIPMLIARWSRRWVYTLGAAAVGFGSMLLAEFTVPAQAVAMLLRVFGSSCLSIGLSLYIMDNIAKANLVRSESIRMSSSVLAWTIGPVTGVWLYQSFGLWAPGAAALGFAGLLASCFWYFRLSDGSPIKPAKSAPADPIANLKRFWSQPRLRLAWLIAFCRSAYWSTYFVYGPILMVATGQGKLAGGVFASLGNVMLLSGLLWARAAGRISLRKTIFICLVSSGVLLMAAGISGTHHPLFTAAFLLAGTAGASGLDAMGSTPFLRAVKPRERAAMTSVYRAYFEFSELLPSFVYSIVLSVFGFGSIFVTLSLLMLVGAAMVWRHLPKAM